MPAMAGYAGSVLITSLPGLGFTNENLVNAGDNKTFNIAAGSAAKRYWDRNASLVVQTAPDMSSPVWSTATASTYTVRHTTGQVVFNSVVSGANPGARVQSGTYLPYATLGDVTEWTFSGEMEMSDVTAMGGGRARVYIPSMLSGEMNITKWWVPEATANEDWTSKITAGTLFVLSLVTPTGQRYEAFVYGSSTEISNSVADPVQREASFQINGMFYAV